MKDNYDGKVFLANDIVLRFRYVAIYFEKLHISLIELVEFQCKIFEWKVNLLKMSCTGKIF